MKALLNKIEKRLSVRTLIVSSVTLTTLIVTAIFLSAVFVRLYEITANDNWAMIYMNLEKKVDTFKDDLLKYVDTNEASKSGVYQLSGSSGSNESRLTYVSGVDSNIRNITDLGFGRKKFEDNLSANKLSLGSFKGKVYVLKALETDKVSILEVPIAEVLPIRVGDLNLTHSFVLTRSGKLIYTSDNSTGDPVSKDIVQRYIRSPLWQGQFEYKNADRSGARYQGFFQEVADTNLVFFVEVPYSVVVNKVAAAYDGFLYILLALLIIVPAITHVLLYVFRKGLYRISNERVGFLQDEIK